MGTRVLTTNSTKTWLLVGAYYAVLVAGLGAMLADGLGLLALAVYYVWMPLGAVLVWRLTTGRLRGLGVGVYPGVVRHLLAGGLAAAGMVGALFAVMALADWVTWDRATWQWAGLVIGVAGQQLVVAMLEELAFRGVIQQVLVAQVGWRRGLLGAAVLFGLFHVPNIAYQEVPLAHVPLTVVALSLMGVVFGWAFERGGRTLALPVALHAGWNMACFGLEDVYAFRFTGPAWLTGVTAWFPESGALGLVGLLLLGSVVWWITRQPSRAAVR